MNICIFAAEIEWKNGKSGKYLKRIDSTASDKYNVQCTVYSTYICVRFCIDLDGKFGIEMFGYFCYPTVCVCLCVCVWKLWELELELKLFIDLFASETNYNRIHSTWNSQIIFYSITTGTIHNIDVKFSCGSFAFIGFCDRLHTQQVE